MSYCVNIFTLIILIHCCYLHLVCVILSLSAAANTATKTSQGTANASTASKDQQGPSLPVRRESRLRSPAAAKNDPASASRLAQQGPPKSTGAGDAGKEQKGSMLTKLFRGSPKEEPIQKPKSLGIGKAATSKVESKIKTPAKLKTQKLKSPSSSRERAPAPPPRDIPIKDQSTRSRPVKSEAGGMKKINSSSSIATTASSTSSGTTPSVSTSPGSSLGSSSPKNALRKLGRAFGGGTKSSKMKEPGKAGAKQPVGRHSPDGQIASSDEGSKLLQMKRTKSDLVKTSSKLVAPKIAMSARQQSSLSKVKPVQTVQGSTSPPNGSAKQIPKSKSSSGVGKTGLKLKTPSNYESVVKREKSGDDKQAFQRGSGIYSTFPGPAQPRNSRDRKSPSPHTSPTKDPLRKSVESPDRLVRTPTASPSRSSANTATVAPFNYIGSRPPSKESSEISLSGTATSECSSGGTPVLSQISVSSISSQSSENSVVYKPPKEEDLCTTVYRNNQAVTTFGTPTLPRSKKICDHVSPPSTREVTIMNVQNNVPGSPARSVKETTFGATKETTFGDNVTTQVRSHKAASECGASPNSSPTPQRSNHSGYTQPGALSYNQSSMHSDGTASLSGAYPPYRANNNGSGGGATTPQRFMPAPSLTRLCPVSMRRTTSNRSHLNDMQLTERDIADEIDDVLDDNMAGGYMSDGDMLHRNAGLGDIASGYMSEGGGMLYARRMNNMAKFDGMAAVREYLQRTVDLSDDER